MVRTQLLDWQWSDYAAKHRTRANLLLHIVTVPLFQAGTLLLIYALLARSEAAGLVGVLCMAAALVVQGRGHKMEPETPVPFAGAVDFVTRFFVEQWVTFPRFLLSGGWYRNLTHDRRS